MDAGYEITIHEAPITQDGWTGAGFSVIDPNTGAGGYLIEGGASGARLAVAILACILIATGISILIFTLFAPESLSFVLLTLLGILQVLTARMNQLGDFRAYLGNLGYGEISTGLAYFFNLQ